MAKNEIVLCKDRCEDESDFWADMMTILDLLTKQEYEVLVRYEDCGVYVLELARDPRKVDFEEDRFVKLSADEEEDIISNREGRSEDSEWEEK